MGNEDLRFTAGLENAGFNQGITGMIGSVTKLGGQLLGLGAASVILKKLADDALEDEVAFSRLKTAIGNTSDGTQKLYDRMKEMSKQMGLTAGFTESDMAKAFTKLTQATGSSEVALKAIGPAMELSRAKGMGLEQSASLVARAYENGTKTIARQTQIYGENKKGMEALDLIQQRFAGNIEKYAATSKGQLESSTAVFMRLGSSGIKPLVEMTADLAKGLAEAADSGVKEFNPFKGVIDDIIFVLREITGVVIPTFVYGLIVLIGDAVNKTKQSFTSLGKVIGDVFTGNFKAIAADSKGIFADYVDTVGKDINKIATFAKNRQHEEMLAIKASKNEEIKINKNAATVEANLDKERFEGAKGFFSGMSSLQKTKNKELFEIGKAAGIANIVVSTAESIMNAWAKIPPPFNIAFAIGAATAGAVELAAASGASFNPAGAASGLYADETMISTFQPREIVIPQRFSDLIASGRMALTGGNTQNNNASGDMHVHIHEAHKKQVPELMRELKHFYKMHRGNRFVLPDGSINY